MYVSRRAALYSLEDATLNFTKVALVALTLKTVFFFFGQMLKLDLCPDTAQTYLEKKKKKIKSVGGFTLSHSLRVETLDHG